MTAGVHRQIGAIAQVPAFLLFVISEDDKYRNRRTDQAEERTRGEISIVCVLLGRHVVHRERVAQIQMEVRLISGDTPQRGLVKL